MVDELQRKMFEFQLLQQHLQELQHRQELVAARIEELSRTKMAFDELKTVKEGDSAMIPMGGDNFIPGKVTDTKNVLVGMGGGIAIKKSLEDAMEIVDKRISDMENVANEIVAQSQSVINQLTNLQTYLESHQKA